jgi:hypothetical protein
VSRVVVTVPVPWQVVADLVIGDSVGRGARLRTPPEFDATVLSVGPAVRAAGFEQFVQFAIDVGGQVALPVTSTLIANWLWGRLHQHARSITIDRQVIELDDEGRAKRVISEHINKSGSSA